MAIPDPLQRFLPAACYLPMGDDVGDRILKCPDVANILTILAAVYNNDPADFHLATDFVGGGSVLTNFPYNPSTLSPRSWVVKRGQTCWQFLEGTTTEAQIAYQAYAIPGPPTNQGFYFASNVYQRMALECVRRFTTAGCGLCDEFGIAGHSMGGAIASLMGATMSRTKPNARLAVITDGAPQCGGPSLIRELRRISQSHIFHPMDPVPLLPPQGPWYNVVFDIVTQIRGLIWERFASYEQYRKLDESGFGIQNDQPGPFGDVYTQLVLNMMANFPLGSYVPHLAATYAANARTFCGIP